MGIGGIGDFMDYVDIIEMGRHGAKYYVIYDLREDWGAHDSKGRFYAVVERKNFDGTEYWTLHYQRKLAGSPAGAASSGFTDVTPGTKKDTPARVLLFVSAQALA